MAVATLSWTRAGNSSRSNDFSFTVTLTDHIANTTICQYIPAKIQGKTDLKLNFVTSPDYPLHADVSGDPHQSKVLGTAFQCFPVEYRPKSDGGKSTPCAVEPDSCFFNSSYFRIQFRNNNPQQSNPRII